MGDWTLQLDAYGDSFRRVDSTVKHGADMLAQTLPILSREDFPSLTLIVINPLSKTMETASIFFEDQTGQVKPEDVNLKDLMARSGLLNPKKTN